MRVKRWLRRLGNKSERGQALVEFTLVSIVFFFVFFGIFDGIRLVQSWVTVQHAAREGARFAITGQTGCDKDEDGNYGIIARDDCIAWTARRATEGISGGGTGASPSKVGVTYRSWDFLKDDWSTTPVSNATGKPCDQIEVKVTYRHKFITPIIAAVVPSGVNLVGQQRMANEPWGPCENADGVAGGS